MASELPWPLFPHSQAVETSAEGLPSELLASITSAHANGGVQALRGEVSDAAGIEEGLSFTAAPSLSFTALPFLLCHR